MPDFEDAKSINSAIALSHNNWHSAKVFQETPEMKGRLASQAAYALQGQQIDYVTAEISDEPSFVSVLFFAGERIVCVRSDDHENGPSTSIFSRKQIDSLDIVHTPNLLSSNWGQSSSVTVVVGVAGQKFTLPGDVSASMKNLAELETFLPKLLELASNR